MKVVVQDASVLIDLAAADLLGAWFSLGNLAVDRTAVLLTGDRNLRTSAEAREVTVYGLPALMDYMVQEEALSAATAITKLELLCRLNPRLQKRECEPLLTKWRNA